jgi:hypothetical protein
LATGVGSAGAAARRDADRARSDAAVSVADGWSRTRAAIWRGYGDGGGLGGGGIGEVV